MVTFLDKIIEKLAEIKYNIEPEQEEKGFEKIAGYADVKDLVRRALDAQDNVNLLFIGPPASAKTMFLQGIIEMYPKESVYFDATNTTNRALDVFAAKRPKIICIDELEKMPINFQNKLLNFLESGHVKVDQKNVQYDFKIKNAKVFGSANDPKKISKPLLSRFGQPLYLQKYTHEQFLFVSQKVLKLDGDIARFIGEQVFAVDGDIRDVIQIGKLVGKKGTRDDVLTVLRTMHKYDKET